MVEIDIPETISEIRETDQTREGFFTKLRRSHVARFVGAGLLTLGLTAEAAHVADSPDKPSHPQSKQVSLSSAEAQQQSVQPSQEMLAAEGAAYAQQVSDYVAAVDAAKKQQELHDYLVAQAAAAMIVHYGSAYPRPSYDHWMAIHQCEQPESTGGWTAQDSRFGGGLGIGTDTWYEYGGRQFAPLPSQATPDQQIEVANRTYEVNGPSAWGCKTNIP